MLMGNNKVQEVAHTDKWIQRNQYPKISMCGQVSILPLPDAKRAATRHLRLLLDLTVRTLLCLLLAIKIYGRDTLQRLMADDITIRDRFHVAYDIGAAKA